MRLGLPIGVAVGLSSFSYSHSIVRGTVTGLGLAIIGTVIQGTIEGRAERLRLSQGIRLNDVPVRPKVVLELVATPTRIIEYCREGLRTGIHIKHIEIDEPLRIVAVTKASFSSFGERMTIEVKAICVEICSLEISSVPRLSTTTSDLGKNYTNVFLLAKFVKDQLGTNAVHGEKLINLAQT
jgi:hypothetical protein